MIVPTLAAGEAAELSLETPHVDAVLPAGVTVGLASELAVTGHVLSKVDRFVIPGADAEILELRHVSDSRIDLRLRIREMSHPGYREIRGDGPNGLTNRLWLRLDPLPQRIEVEPNDRVSEANPLSVGHAVAGTLRSRDIDVFRFPSVRGQRISIEIEARRLGIPLSPILTAFDEKGRALAQGRETRAGDGDCRLDFRAPADGEYLLQVHDRLYRGAEEAGYRLRLDPAPVATGIFPLGGPRGRSILVEASGGTLERPLSRFVTLPDEAGFLVEFPPIDDPRGPITVPQRLIAEQGGEEVYETPADQNGPSATRLPFGHIANGRVGRPGERDRYLVAVERGRPVRVKAEAASLGSWLDSVITLRDADGKILGENDDSDSGPPAAGGVTFPGIGPRAVDSRLDFVPKVRGDVLVEITDRYGEGGPEYSYRLMIGPPGFELSAAFRIETARGHPAKPDSAGPGTRPAVDVLNLRPGTETSLLVAVRTEGRSRPIRIQVIGLPPDVRATPITIRPRIAPGAGPASKGSRATATGRIILKVDPEAKPSGGMARVEASCAGDDGSTLTRRAILTMIRDRTGSMVSDRPIVEELDEVSYRVIPSSR